MLPPIPFIVSPASQPQWGHCAGSVCVNLPCLALRIPVYPKLSDNILTLCPTHTQLSSLIPTSSVFQFARQQFVSLIINPCLPSYKERRSTEPQGFLLWFQMTSVALTLTFLGQFLAPPKLSDQRGLEFPVGVGALLCEAIVFWREKPCSNL